MKLVTELLKDLCIVIPTLLIISLIGYFFIITVFLGGCSLVYDLGYISECGNEIQTSSVSIRQINKGIEITFPKSYKLFDIVFIARKDNSGALLYFDRYTDEYQQVWVLEETVYFKEVYAKYKDKYCLWKKEFYPKE